MKIDEYTNRIYVRIPYADENGKQIDLSELDVITIGIANGASVSPGIGLQDFSNGPVEYTVTAPDGLTTETWSVLVENPPCTGTDILSWELRNDVQVGDAIIDYDAHTISATVKPGTDISALYADYQLDCGATICCNAGACAGELLNLSEEDQCTSCVVTAQDKSITETWLICVDYADVTRPIVTTSSVLVHNCNDETVDVWSNEKGKVYIIEEAYAKSINMLVNARFDEGLSTDEWLEAWFAMNTEARAMLDQAIEDQMGAYADYPYADSISSISAENLMSGKYYAFSVDESGNTY
jgi:hypothetical protein